jgi:hypothetical protein
MKRMILALSVVLVLCLLLAVPAAAAGPHSRIWYLYNTNMTDKWGNSELMMSTTGTPTGQVNVPAGTSKMWISDKIALANVAFPNDSWAIRFGTDADWGKTGAVPNFKCDIGYWDGTVFTILPMGGISPVFYAGYYEMQFQSVPSVGQTVPINTYLAVVVTNNSPVGTNALAGLHPIYTGQELADQSPTGKSFYYSCLTSPQSDPGYPLPELAAGILLGAGILGLGGFMIIRRRKAA